MIDVLLYASLSCSQVNELIDRVGIYQQNDPKATQVQVNEIVEVLKESTPECFK